MAKSAQSANARSTGSADSTAKAAPRSTDSATGNAAHSSASDAAAHSSKSNTAASHKRRIAAPASSQTKQQADLQRILSPVLQLTNDPYFPCVVEKHLHGSNTDKIAASIPCDPSTVNRNISRIIRKLVDWAHRL